MSEEITTFDLADMLSGNHYPEREVTVYVNEAAFYEAGRLSNRIREVKETGGDSEETLAEIDRLEARLSEIKDEVEKSRFVFTLRGVPRSALVTAVEKIEEEFPSTYTALGQRRPNAKADNQMAIAQWALYIQSIESPSGAKVGPLTPEEAEALRSGLPAVVADDVEAAISELHTSVRDGYESLRTGTDFLSKR